MLKNNNQRIEDPAMDMARRVAGVFKLCSRLPDSLKNPADRAIFLDAIDGCIAPVAGYYDLTEQEQKKFISQIAELSEVFVTDLEDDEKRVNVTLRIWAGCLDAAKTIAMETRNGPNTRREREILFKSTIDPRSLTDPIYCAGVEAAPFFKSQRNEQFSFDGVPKHSKVRIEYEKFLVEQDAEAN